MSSRKPRIRKRNRKKKKGEARGLASLWIYPRFQKSLLSGNLMLMLIAVGTIGGAVGFFMMEMYAQGQALGLSATHPYYKFLDYQVQRLGLITLVSVAVLIPLASILNLVLSHRMAGPLVRLRRHFNEVKETGRFVEISFRENDYLKEWSEEINESYSAVIRKAGGQVSNRRRAG
jgi:sensor histidine kinase YesM